LGIAVKLIPIAVGENTALDFSAVVSRRENPNVQKRTVNKHTGWTVTEKQEPELTATTAIQPADHCSSRIL
jgi:hypothetical protein